MDLERRIEKLEQENRRLKRIGGLVVAVFAVATLAGFVVAQEEQEQEESEPEVLEEIEARLFRVVDADGNPLAELSSYGTGSRLVLVDQSGRWRVVLGALEGGPEIALRDHENDDVIWREGR